MSTGHPDERARLWVWVYALALVGITAIPYLIGFINKGEGFEFTGFIFAVDDGNSYIAKMLLGNRGDWLFSTPYTDFPQRGILIYLPYLLLGKLTPSPGFHGQMVVLFQLFRLAAGVLVVLATYDFVSLFTQSFRTRFLSLVVITAGGGLGWLLLVTGLDGGFGSLPLEFYSPESFGFLAIYGLPHLALSRALLLWGFVVLLKSSSPEPERLPSSEAERKATLGQTEVGERGVQRFGSGIGLGLLWVGVGLTQPISLLLAWGLTALYLGSRALHLRRKNTDRLTTGGWAAWKKGLRMSLVAGLMSFPLLTYYGSLYFTDPFFTRWGQQNLIYSPSPTHYLAAFGMMLPFALVGIIQGLRTNPSRILLLLVWAAAFPFLAYAPLTIQRRLPEGIWVVLVALAFLGIESLAERKPAFQKLGILAVCLSLVTTLMLLSGGILTAREVSLPLYRPRDEIAAFEALAEEAEAGALVMTSFTTGNALPAWVPLRVAIGHGPESIDLAEKQRSITRFFSQATTDSERRKILEDLGIRYVFWGPQEKSLGGWDVSSAPYLRLVSSLGEYSSFEVVQDR